jgi:hypothetical protein
MKQFLVFAGDCNYPYGGWSDFKGDYSTLSEAQAAIAPSRSTWAQIVNTKTGSIVEYGS